jgi:hypothetical protein
MSIKLYTKVYKAMALSFCDLGDDDIQIIIGHVKHYSYLALLKRTCVTNYNSVSKLSIAKLMLSYKLCQFSPRTFCVNINCCEDTKAVFYKHYHNTNPDYVHIKQFALKKTTALINEKKYKFNTHYCAECLKKFVLVGDLRNVKHNYDYIDEVNITYARCKYIFV